MAHLSDSHWALASGHELHVCSDGQFPQNPDSVFRSDPPTRFLGYQRSEQAVNGFLK